MGQLLPFPELPKFPAAIQARCAAVVGAGVAVPHRRARWCPLFPPFPPFLWTGMVLFVFKRVPPIRLSLAASSKLHPILMVCMHWMNLG